MRIPSIYGEWEIEREVCMGRGRSAWGEGGLHGEREVCMGSGRLRGRSAWGEGGLHGEREVCMGRGRSAWGEGGLHGEREVCMGRGRSAWGEGGLHGEREVCMGRGRPAWEEGLGRGRPGDEATYTLDVNVLAIPVAVPKEVWRLTTIARVLLILGLCISMHTMLDPSPSLTVVDIFSNPTSNSKNKDDTVTPHTVTALQ